MGLLHAADADEMLTIEGTPTECADIVPDRDVSELPAEVTCPACLAVLSAKKAGSYAKNAIKIGEASGLYRDAAIARKGPGSSGR